MTDYRALAKTFSASRRLGQSFLVDSGVAEAEAEYARGRVVVEVGAGLGMLTMELCRVARRVIAVEYDRRLFEYLSCNFHERNLELINADFFELGDGSFKNADMMVSNIPYSLSSKTIAWLAGHGMPAVLCLQKEFVEHMLASPGTRKYSKLSVTTALNFKVHELMQVPASKFYPKPRVDSKIVYLKPQDRKIGKDALDIIGLLMMHRKKKLRNAVIDSAKALNLGREGAAGLAERLDFKDTRVFMIEPELMLRVAMQILNLSVE